ncbi:hypothetical protein JCM9279_000193 [Rhodotorula babjevae]
MQQQQQHPSQSPSAWLGAPSPSSTLLPPPPHLPLPSARQRTLSARPSLAPPAASQAPSSLANPHSADPATEARRAIALFVGAGDPAAPAEGLLDRVQRDIDALLAAYEHAFSPRTPSSPPTSSSSSSSPAPDPSRALDSLDALVSLLARSAPGGFVPSTMTMTMATPDAPLAQAHLDRASERAQALFREGVRAREGAEVVRAGLSG